MYLESSDGDYVLRCAYCNHEYTHQDEVIVFNRAEDSVGKVMRARIDWHEVTIDECMCGNPSPRRQGAVIACTCEVCSGVSEVVIMQHKGQTMINVRRAGYRHKVSDCGLIRAAKG